MTNPTPTLSLTQWDHDSGLGGNPSAFFKVFFIFLERIKKLSFLCACVFFIVYFCFVLSCFLERVKNGGNSELTDETFSP